MTKQIIYFVCLLAVIAVTITSHAQDNNTTSNLTTNSTTLNGSQIIGQPSFAPGNSSSTVALNDTAARALGDASPKKTIRVDTALNQTSQNLSTVDNITIIAAPISEMAKKAPEVAATASSVQVAYAPEGALKLGSGIGGWDPSNPTHREVDSQELGMAVKPMRDTEKMFFVCDIV